MRQPKCHPERPESAAAGEESRRTCGCFSFPGPATKEWVPQVPPLGPGIARTHPRPWPTLTNPKKNGAPSFASFLRKVGHHATHIVVRPSQSGLFGSRLDRCSPRGSLLRTPVPHFSAAGSTYSLRRQRNKRLRSPRSAQITRLHPEAALRNRPQAASQPVSR